MPSKRELIVDAVVDRLDAAGALKPSGLAVHRYRKRAIEEDDLPAMVVYCVGDQTGQDDLTGNQEHTLTVRVECRTTGDPPDSALDPLYVWAVSALLEDTTLGGLAIDVNETATQWDAEQADQLYAAAAVEFEITHLTAVGDPTAQPGD